MFALREKLFVLFFLFFVKGVVFAQKQCFDEAIFHQKSLRDSYLSLRAASKSCEIASTSYLVYGERAILAKRYAEALWAAQQGQKVASSKEKYPLLLMEGWAFLHLGRLEESITALKKIAYNKSLYSASSSLAASAHLLLIKSYYLRAGKKKDDNVLFLYNLFHKRYSKRPELEMLQAWFATIT